MLTGILLCSILIPAAVSLAPQSDDKAELLRLEQIWNEAHLRGDGKALDELWADDLIVTVPRMQPLLKPEALSMVGSPRIRFQGYETSDLQVSLRGEAAVVTGRLRRTRKMGERTVEDDWRFTKTYIRQDGKWKVLAFHASEAP